MKQKTNLEKSNIIGIHGMLWLMAKMSQGIQYIFNVVEMQWENLLYISLNKINSSSSISKCQTCSIVILLKLVIKLIWINLNKNNLTIKINSQHNSLNWIEEKDIYIKNLHNLNHSLNNLNLRNKSIRVKHLSMNNQIKTAAKKNNKWGKSAIKTIGYWIKNQ